MIVIVRVIAMRRETYQDNPAVYVTKDGRVVVLPQERYKQIKQEYDIRKSDKANIWVYEKSGVHRLYSAYEMMALIKSTLPVEYRSAHDWKAVYDELLTDRANVSESDFNNDENIVNFRNGVLDISTGQLSPHNPKYLSTIQIPCNYIPSSTLQDCATFSAFLDHLCATDCVTITFLLEFLGAIISNAKGWRFKKMLLLVGAGNTGKSVFRELAMHLVGLENCVSIDLKKLNERFGTSALYGKRLAGSGDMAFVELPEVNILKQLTGGDELFAEYKGKDSFTFRYDGFIFCNCNKLPYFRSDRGAHVYERFLVVCCSNVVPAEERDPKLLDKLLAEKDAIVSVAIKEFMSVIQNGYRFTESEAMQIGRDSYEIENNSLLTFVNECCERGDSVIKRSEFGRYYAKWCKANFVQAERARDIEPQLVRFFGIQSHKRNGYYVFTGLEIRIEVVDELDDVMYPDSTRNRRK